MINMKRILCLIVAVCFIYDSYSQSKFGNDEQACKENLTIYREYYKQKQFSDALNPWRWTFNNCPAASGNIYKNGPKIIKERIKTDDANKEAYIDTLMMIFDQRIEYGFGEEGYILGLKGYELVLIDKGRSQEAFNILEKGIQLSGNKSDFRSVYGYMRAVVNLERSGIKTKQDVLDVYSIVSTIVQYNIINESKSTKYFVQYSEKIEKLFTPYANCEDLLELFSKRYDDNSDNVVFLQRAKKVLEHKECITTELYSNILLRLFELDSSASLAYVISKNYIAKGKSKDAISFANQALELEEEEYNKAKYFLALADAYRAANSYSLARDAVYQALGIRDSWGEAYMSLGNIYIAGSKVCGDDFEQKTVYWVAIDAFRLALSDEDTKERASKSINTYSKYFPTKEICFFNGVDANKSHLVECWINKTTIARTSD
jgi:tetratricopeptide (TPR) repeat protein